MMPPESPLSQRLARTVRGGFFRPLARPSAAVYVDCADRLERGADEGGQLTYADALAVIRDVLGLHPRAELAADEGAETQDLRQRAGKIFNNLLEAGWLEERAVSLDARWVLITPALRPLLRALRELAEDEAAELKDFEATLEGICKTLLAEGALDPRRLSPADMRKTVKDLLLRVQLAVDQMHAVEKLILAYAERQRHSASGGETLRLLYTDFYAGQHMVCYDVLRRGGLIPRLNQAREIAQTALGDPFVKQRLSEGLQAHKRLEPQPAYLEAEQMLTRLERALGGIPAKAGLIDGRIADFSRLSRQRYRYQSEIRGHRPEQVRTLLQAADRAWAGRRFAELASEPGLRLLCPDVRLYFGRESLARARRARLPVDLSVAETTPAIDANEAQDFIRRRNLYAIAPSRAARFIQQHLPDKGARLTTADLRLATEDDLYDLLAVIAFERASGSVPHQPLRWRVEQARRDLGLEPEKIPIDTQAGHRLERLALERLS